ncbi:MAG: hypothetical protein GY761_21755 [Hyphomicrobiales bacterium]|nr:hypothetical protein [Hyphomicrobiales bacterium]
MAQLILNRSIIIATSIWLWMATAVPTSATEAQTVIYAMQQVTEMAGQLRLLKLQTARAENVQLSLTPTTCRILATALVMVGMKI